MQKTPHTRVRMDKTIRYLATIHTRVGCVYPSWPEFDSRIAIPDRIWPG